MRVSSIFLFAAIATETVSAQGIFRGRNDDNRVRALVEEVSMSASADLSLSFSFGGINGAEIAGIGKAGKSSPTPTEPPTRKPTRSPVIGKSGKSVAPTPPAPPPPQVYKRLQENESEIWQDLTLVVDLV